MKSLEAPMPFFRLGIARPITVFLAYIFNVHRSFIKNGRMQVYISNLGKIESIFCHTNSSKGLSTQNHDAEASRKVLLHINECLSKVKNAVNRLARINHVILASDYVEAISNGLPKVYDTFAI